MGHMIVLLKNVQVDFHNGCIPPPVNKNSSFSTPFPTFQIWYIMVNKTIFLRQLKHTMQIKGHIP